MKRSMITGVILGILTSIPVLLLTALADRAFMLPFVPFVIFDFMVRILPGFILIPSIHLMSRMLLFFNVASLSSAAKLAEQSTAIVMFVVSGGVAGGILGMIAAMRKQVNLSFTGAILGFIGFLSFLAILGYQGVPESGFIMSFVWLGIIFTGWGSLVGWQIHRIQAGGERAPAESVRSGKQFLLGNSVVALLSIVIALLIFRKQKETPDPLTLTRSLMETTGISAETPSEEVLAARIEPAPGTRSEITPINDFYRIDIVTRPPHIDEADWRLEITGLVEHQDSLTLDDIRAYPSVSQYATMSCISNTIGGPLISTGLWTGVPLMTLLNDLGLQPEASMVYVEAEDGFYELVREEDMRDPRTLLVYELNGEPLNADQGFPLRFLIPNRYGMKQPKWIVSLKIISEDGVGFWVDRGWDNDAVVQMTSVIDKVSTDMPDPVTGAIPIGGIAYSGDRGIGKVEIQIDSGDWEEVQLRTPPLSSMTWVQWRYYWQPEPGKHTARVRAFDGSDIMQTPEEHGEYPRGATGYHMVEFEI